MVKGVAVPLDPICEKSPLRSSVCRNPGSEGIPLAQPKALITEEEEQLVLNNRAADVGAELVLGKGSTSYVALVVEEVVGVQHLVAQELVCRTMEAVRARFCREVDHSTGKPAVFRTQVVGLDLEFLDGVLRRDHGDNVQIRSVRRHTVNQNLALTRPCRRPPENLQERKDWRRPGCSSEEFPPEGWPCGTTPGTSATRASGLRPFRGSSVTDRCSMTCPKRVRFRLEAKASQRLPRPSRFTHRPAG